VKKTAEKIAKYTPSKSAGGKKESPAKGKISTKRSATGGAKKFPANPSPSGKKSTKTTDHVSMTTFKKYLDWHDKNKKTGGAGKGSTGKVLGKRSAAGKSSTASGKSKGKKSAK